MKLGIQGVGLWGQGLTQWQDFLQGTQDGFAVSADDPGVPVPESIPARERRRAPRAVKLAVEVINQASAMANIDAQELCSVFASAMGDSHITDYICTTLSGETKMLSPTKFHNSVHNSASGYWSISTGNRQPSTFVSAFDKSFAAALLETATLSLSERKPATLAIYDVAFGAPLYDICPISEDFAAAFIVTPDPNAAQWTLDLQFQAGHAIDTASKSQFIAERIAHNPSAQALRLCELLAGNGATEACWSLGPDAHLLAARA